MNDAILSNEKFFRSRIGSALYEKLSLAQVDFSSFFVGRERTKILNHRRQIKTDEKKTKN